MVDDDMGNGEAATHAPADPRDRATDPEAEIARLTALLQETQKHLEAKVAERTAAARLSRSAGYLASR